jgi:pimeloyl-ACP methyl ester carboxylesterase
VTGTEKSTIVRSISRVAIRFADRLWPAVAARLATRIWFTLPAKPWPHAVHGGTPFHVWSGEARVLGRAWGDGPVVYLVHGWGGRASQLAGLVQPLTAAGFRVVMFDGPSHGVSGPGALGARSTHGLEQSRAFGEVVARFGPAHTVVAHSFGALTTLLTMKYGALSAGKLVLLAPMVEWATIVDGFQHTLGFGNRTRRHFDRLVPAQVGLPAADFSLNRLFEAVGPVPTLVVHDRHDTQTAYSDSAALAARLDHVDLVGTYGLGHLLLLRDRSVIQEVTDYLQSAPESGVLPTWPDRPRPGELRPSRDSRQPRRAGRHTVRAL